MGSRFFANGVVYSRQGDHKRAIESFDQALHLNSTDANIYGHRCVARHRLGDMEGAIALSAFGKHTYLFGNLPVDDERLEATAAAVMTGASQHYDKSDTISYIKCLELLKKNVLAKIPPLPESHSNFGGA